MDSSIARHPGNDTASCMNIHPLVPRNGGFAAAKFVNIHKPALRYVLYDHAYLVAVCFEHHGDHVNTGIQPGTGRAIGVRLNLVGKLADIFLPYFLASGFKTSGTGT